MLVGVGTVFVGAGITQPTNTVAFSLGAGIRSSLSASLILGFFATRQVVDQAAEKLLQLESAADARSRYGATLVDEKYGRKPEYWRRVTTQASKRLYLIGHALDTWVQPEFRESFIEAIDRVARSGGSVCVITLDPSGSAQDRIADTRGIDYSARIRETLLAIAEDYARVPKGLQGNIEVRRLPESEQPLYMAVINDVSLEYSTYLMRMSTKTTMHAPFAISSPFGSTILADFGALRERCPRLDLTQVRSD
ncbi:hypothetical protein [Microbacterium sp. nov. GSS16]|uniref:hypothetical protein n=1 Tax=Microbacterium sp. nov. GSS16 TaxID=3019890 RepID=UPI002306DB40|nr:hypothetical protein [Microbacterium sp. nov. GSS16]WCD93082.1 hypothetical protein PGB26_02040 [Microbacterium sp. nov. GSS16]